MMRNSGGARSCPIVRRRASGHIRVVSDGENSQNQHRARLFEFQRPRNGSAQWICALIAPSFAQPLAPPSPLKEIRALPQASQTARSVSNFLKLSAFVPQLRRCAVSLPLSRRGLQQAPCSVAAQRRDVSGTFSQHCMHVCGWVQQYGGGVV